MVERSEVVVNTVWS